LAVTFLLGRDKTKLIYKHKNKRIDAQYYMKVDKEERVWQMLKGAKMFVSMFDERVSSLNEKKINSYRRKLRNNK